MCGIFGWIPSPRYERHDIHAIARAQCEALHHRGPDDQGFIIFPADRSISPCTEQSVPRQLPFRLLLGQTRHSILDLSPAGHQPMRTDDGRHTLVYNGEVYNYLELRKELEEEGARFHSATDSEVVLQALIHWGERALLRFTGMFALALYDAREDTLLLARDCFGIKPLYWSQGEYGFCFASELPALLQFPAMRRIADANAAYQFLCYGQYDCGPRTFVQGVNNLPGGHVLKISLPCTTGDQSPRCYWRPDISRTASVKFSDAAAHLRELFLRSVRLHLRSDVPLGVALSGGIDSSATTCAVRHLEPDAPLHTFSFIARGSAISEERWAGLVAQTTGAIRHSVEVSPSELARDIDPMLKALGEPFGSTSIYAQYRVFQLARQCGITVTLDGQGADELLAGYAGYPGERMATLLHAGHLIAAAHFFAAASGWPGRSPSYVFQQTVRQCIPAWLMPLALRMVGRSTAPDWLDMAALRACGVRPARDDTRKIRFPSHQYLRQTLAYQLSWCGLPQLLRHGDRNAMAFSIESRVPFLTREIAEFCLSLPEEFLCDMHGRSKSVFREAMRGIVPDTILDRRDKIGFATPEYSWMTHLADWVEEVLADKISIPYLRLDVARREWRAVREGKRAYTASVWRWLCYTRWAQIFSIENA